jgi:hypothetical protein
VFPAASYAATVYEYVVAEVSPVFEYDVVVVVAICTPPLYTLYPFTAVLSVDAVQARLSCEDETGVTVNPEGIDGAVVSVTTTVFEAEQLAVAPPFDPAQVQLHGPEPETVDAVPVEQRLVVGIEETVVPFDVPQVPTTGAGRMLTVTDLVILPPVPVQVTL